MQNSGIRLVEKNNEHWYWVPELEDEVKSVTTILKVLSKPYLIPWSLNRMIERAIDMFKDNLTLEEFKQILLTSKGEGDRARDDAGDVGSRVHHIIDEFMKLVIAGQEPAEPMDMVASETDFRVVSCFRAFLDWFKSSGYQPIESEKKQASLIHRYAGTIDDIGRIGDKTVLMDLKSSNQIGDDYYSQVAAYVYMEEERNPGIKFDEAWIIRLGKSDGSFEARWISRADIDTAFEGFLAAKTADLVRDYLKSINKKQKKSLTI